MWREAAGTVSPPPDSTKGTVAVLYHVLVLALRLIKRSRVEIAQSLTKLARIPGPSMRSRWTYFEPKRENSRCRKRDGDGAGDLGGKEPQGGGRLIASVRSGA